MRKIRNRKSSHSNPLAMFSAGVEQVVRDHQTYQSEDMDQETLAMARVQSKPKQEVSCNLFAVLLARLC